MADKCQVSYFYLFEAILCWLCIVASSGWKRCRFSHLIPTAPTISADLQVIWSYYSYLKYSMENSFSLWARKSFVFGSPQIIDNRPRKSTASSCLSRRWCQSEGVAYSLISTYHGGAYLQISLSFLASRGNRTKLSWAYIWSPRQPEVNVTIYNVFCPYILMLMFFFSIVRWQEKYYLHKKVAIVTTVTK